MTLTGILLGPTPVAIIRAGGHTFIAKVGEPVGDAVVTAILPSKVVLRLGTATFDLPAPSFGPAPLRAMGPRISAAPALPSRAVVRSAPPATAAPVKGVAPAPPGAGMAVTGILEGRGRVAIIEAGGQSFVAGVGDTVAGAVVVSVLPNKVVLKKDGALFELPIGRAAARTPAR